MQKNIFYFFFLNESSDIVNMTIYRKCFNVTDFKVGLKMALTDFGFL